MHALPLPAPKPHLAPLCHQVPTDHTSAICKALQKNQDLKALLLKKPGLFQIILWGRKQRFLVVAIPGQVFQWVLLLLHDKVTEQHWLHQEGNCKSLLKSTCEKRACPTYGCNTLISWEQGVKILRQSSRYKFAFLLITSPTCCYAFCPV